MYSNVTPPTLPSYDSVANPYYLIQFEYAIGAENWETVRFWYGAAPLTWNGSAVTNAVAFSLFTYGTGSPEWTAWGVMAEAGEMALTPGPTTADTYMRLYTNHDILDGTGAVWLAKGTVTPTEEDEEAEIQIRIKSQMAGIIAAWCAPVRQFPKPTAEPVAFLYGHVAKEGETPTHNINGVDYVGWIGPKVQQWDTTVHPYGLLLYLPDYGIAKMLVCTEPFVCDADTAMITPAGDWVRYTLELAEGVWSVENSGSAGGRPVNGKPDWSNYDILSTDGTVYVGGSEPVPVYE